ncbi:MAG: hypothetical protein MSA15_10800 [Clostridium sp.]|nr:hypothetical protein [Clostridium sp.]
MNEEEKKAINDFKRTVELYEAKPIDKISVEFDEFDYKIVKIVLNLIEKLQKENEELKADNYELNNRITDLLENIPVQKVKDKIEEILNNKEYRIVFEGNAEFPDDATIINAQKYIKLEKMQELIEERKVK